MITLQPRNDGMQPQEVIGNFEKMLTILCKILKTFYQNTKKFKSCFNLRVCLIKIFRESNPAEAVQYYNKSIRTFLMLAPLLSCGGEYALCRHRTEL